MPVTRSMKSFSATATATASAESNETSATEQTRSTYATRTTGATTETEATPRTDAAHEPEATSVLGPEPTSAELGTSCKGTLKKIAKSISAKSKKRDLAKAREELLELQVKLAAAKVAALEEDTEDEEEDPEESTLREERTTEWIRKSTLALSLAPHHIEPEPKGDLEQPKEDEIVHRTLPPANVMKTSCRPEPTTQKAQEIEDRQAVPYYGREASPVNYNKLASAITLAARTIQPANRCELPIFNGSSSDWLPFKTAYEESAPLLTEQENLARLRRSLKGAAREAVQCLFVGVTSSQEVLRLLQSRFGRPDALALAELNKLRNLHRLTENPRDICTFASKIINVTATVKALGKPHFLYNAEIVRIVVEKLPSALKYRYYDYAAEQPEDVPDLITLSTFMERTATRCGTYAPAENITTEDRRETNIRRPLRSYHMHEARSDASYKPTCTICRRETHAAPECPKMKEANVSARWELAKKHRLCFRCLRLRKMNHICKPKKCGIDDCVHYHNELLHNSAPSTPKQIEKETTQTVASVKLERSNTAYLKMLPVEVEGPKGTCATYALLDDGSTCSLIENEVAEKIGAEGSRDPFYMEGVAGARIDAQDSRHVKIALRGADGKPHAVTARTMRSLKLAPQTITEDVLTRCEHLRDIETTLTYHRAAPKILLGQDNWSLLVAHELRQGEKNQPVASRTDLGWVLHGVKEARSKQTHRVHHLTIIDEAEQESMEHMMREHFSLESLAITPRQSYNDDERRALQTLQETTKRLPAGGYETGLLWRHNDIQIPHSYDTALRRLELVEKKLNKDESLKRRYEEQIQVLLSNNYAELATCSTSDTRKWYLPHFAVINPQKPEKLRIVHDAAAKSRGVSLNDMLLPGPDLLQSLPGVLMRFRQRAIAVSADIKDMFLRVTIREEDRDMQRFLWRHGETNREPTEYRMKSVIFGATSSPCTAIYVKNQNAEQFKEKYPEAATAVVNNHYVDDYLASYNTIEEAVRVSTEVQTIHKEANYYFQRWASNSTTALQQLAPGTSGNTLQLDDTKILGMVWQPSEDTLTFNVNEQRIPKEVLDGRHTPTKREALRIVMSIFDPLGIATPITIQAKKIMQDVWRSGIDWDEVLQETETQEFSKWLREARRLPTLKIQRSYQKLAVATTIQLHTFVDASSTAYGAVSYWRVTDKDGNTHLSLVAAKGKVAPLKIVSIPRLELQAAVVGCRLAETILAEHEYKPNNTYYWTDSRTVLTWIKNGPRTYKPFVAHRLAEIAEHTKTKDWRWVPTKHNPADDATREVPHDFESGHRWFGGPDFLYNDEQDWPRERGDDNNDENEANEERTYVTNITTNKMEALPDVRRFSSWLRLLRATGRVLQFIQRLRTTKSQCATVTKRNKKNAEADPAWSRIKTTEKKPIGITTTPVTGRKYLNLTAEHLQDAETLWLRALQEETFPEEIAALKRGSTLHNTSRLSKLAVILDDNGIIRLRSRIAAANDITETQKSPAILDGNHPWAKLYITWVHKQTHHGGFGITTNEVRQQYWLLRLRNAVRGALKRCSLCQLRRNTPTQPSTGNHPISRLAHHQRAFTFTGLDYFGPMTITVGRGRQKRYGVIFTCLTTRAVHIELAGDLSCDATIMALRRFIARRGCPTELWSDQGTNLKGADAELRYAATAGLQQDAAARFIKWRYIPPSAPFMGGAWERLVRSIKTALNIVLQERAPREEVLHTLLIEAEHTLNSRPLTHVSTSADDDEALTPNHLLLGGPSRVPLPGVFTEDDEHCKKMWRTSQRLADMFWARWIKEYLPELQHRREPRAKGAPICMGDLVLIADGTLPRNSWPRGKIIATYPGPDGEVRAVDVQTCRGVLRRPTKKLVVIVSSGLREPQNSS